METLSSSASAISCLYGGHVSELKESAHTNNQLQINTKTHSIIPNIEARLYAQCRANALDFIS